MQLKNRLTESLGTNTFSKKAPFFYAGEVVSRLKGGDVEAIELGTHEKKERINIYQQRGELNDPDVIHDVRLLVKSIEQGSGEIELEASYSAEVERESLHITHVSPIEFLSPRLEDFFELSFRESIRLLGSDVYKEIFEKNKSDFRRRLTR
jgi:hypothetical protein